MKYIKIFLLLICLSIFILNCYATETKKLYTMYSDEIEGIYAIYSHEIIPLDEMVDVSELLKKTFKPEKKHNIYTTIFIFNKIIDFNKVLTNKNDRYTTTIEISQQGPDIEYSAYSFDNSHKWMNHESFCYIKFGQCVAFCFDNMYKDVLDYKYNYKPVNQFKEVAPYKSLGGHPVCER